PNFLVVTNLPIRQFDSNTIRQLYEHPRATGTASVVRGLWSVDWLGPWLIRNQAQSAGVFVEKGPIVHPKGRSPDVYLFSPRSTVHGPWLIREMIEIRSNYPVIRSL